MTEDSCKNNERKGIGYMFISVILLSVLPIGFKFAEAHFSPFLFSAIIQFFGSIFCLMFLMLRYPKLAFNKQVYSSVGRSWRNRMILYACFGAFLGYPSFAFSLNYIDVSVAVVLYEIWPFFMILITAFLFRHTERYHKVTTMTILLLFLGFSGFGFVIFSQIDDFTDINFYDINTVFFVGILAAIIGALGTALVPSYTLKWGKDESEKITHAYYDKISQEFFFVIFALMIVRIIVSFFIGFIGVFSGETITIESASVAAACGLFIAGASSMMLRYANMITNNLGVNALSYTSPIFSLIFLSMLTLINVPHLDLLIIGACAIISANLLINAKAEIRMAYKVLIVFLWLGGAIVHIHSGYPLPNYSGMVSIFVIVFILILSFRTDRLVRRTTNEEEIMFSLYQRITLFATNNPIDKNIHNDCSIMIKKLLEIDSYQSNTALQLAYNEFKYLILEFGNKIDAADKGKLSNVEKDVDILAHSKQQGENFGELIALGSVGVILIAALLLFYPEEIRGNAEVFIKTAAFVIAAVVVFLFFNIFDLQNDRKYSILQHKQCEKLKLSYYSIVFRDSENREFGQKLSIAVCFLIVIVYVLLFKWDI